MGDQVYVMICASFVTKYWHSHGVDFCMGSESNNDMRIYPIEKKNC